MSKELVKIGIRIVDRPRSIPNQPGQPYRPAKKQVFKAIATCEINGKRYSKTASLESEAESRDEAYSKLATLVAKQGAVPAKGFGFNEDEPQSS